ncbi:MAG TPA: hypothetical protein DCM05_05225, partial [Elusimicrobia bacterium]|nr:hypothetical protein [Elusimicrobiota bacterium]
MSAIFRIGRAFAAAALLAGPSGPVYAGPTGAPQASRDAPQLKAPLYFEANRGQTDAAVKFFARAAGYNLYLTAKEAVMVMPKAVGAEGRGFSVVRMGLQGANADPSVMGQELLPSRSSYFTGKDASKWRTGVEQYAKVRYGQVYPGIDMVYYASRGHVEYDFIVAPGADPGRILMGFDGGKDLRLDSQGNLIVEVEGGALTYKAPSLYQMRRAAREPVKGRFALAGNKLVRFEVGAYDKSRELVIDPQLVYSSYLGGALDDYAYAIAVDASGNIYVTGATVSDPFPGVVVGTSYQGHKDGAVGSDAFVTKINANGTMAWSTFLGGSGIDIGLGIAVNSTTGKVYITGSTTVESTFPTHTSSGTLGGTDAFAAGLSADGTALDYAVVFGGPQEESGKGIAVDAAGSAYVTGHTGSLAADSFPVTAGAAQTAAGVGADQAFVSKFTPAGVLAYSTYLGGANPSHGNAIAVDLSGNAYVTGQTGDAFVSVAAYPSVFKNTIAGASDAFIAKLNPSGSSFLYKTYVGGDTLDEGTGIALDSSNNVYITGWTDSTTNFPDTSFARIGQTVKGTGEDAFVFKLNTAGGGGHNDGVYATYLGASGSDRGAAIVVDVQGNAYVTGRTFSGDFPLVGPISGQESLVGTAEAFVTQLSPTGASRGFSTYLGAATDNGGQGIALDSTNNIYVTGWTNSASFPTASPSQASNAGSFDAFVTKISPAVDIIPPAVAIASPPAGSYFNTASTTAIINYSDAGGSGLNLSSFVLRLDGVAIAATAGSSQATANLVGLSQGVHTLDASIYDNAGNLGSATQVSFTVDLTAPSIAIASPTAGSFFNYASTTAIINYADTGGSGLNLASLVVRLDGNLVAATAGASQATALLSGLAQGVHTLDASIADNAGNLTSASQISFTVDLTSPTIAIASPTAGSFINAASTAAIINYADTGGSGLNLASLVVRLDGTPVAASAGASQATALLSGLAQGVHTLDASIADNVGNLTSAV